MQATLPEMPMTNSLEDVLDFIYRVKEPEYFQERGSADLSSEEKQP